LGVHKDNAACLVDNDKGIRGGFDNKTEEFISLPTIVDFFLEVLLIQPPCHPFYLIFGSRFTKSDFSLSALER
jgi:hypothetical protein